MSYQQLGTLLKATCVCKWPWRIDLQFERGTIEGHSTFQFTFGYSGSGAQKFYSFLRQSGFNVSENQVFRAQEGDVFNANPATGGKLYIAHGLNLAPDAARKLLFEEACKQVAGLKVLSDRDDWVEAAKGDDYSVLLYFKKTGGLFEATISPHTTSGFLGMGMPQPEQVWSQLGYRLQENLGNEVTWTNGDAKIVAYYGRPGSLNEIHYVVPEKSTTAETEAAAWRELGFFGGGRGCIESARLVGGMCYTDEDAVDSIIRFTKDEWKVALPQGFWLVKAEAGDTSASCRYCLGYDSRHDGTWQTVIEAMEKSGSLPRCASKPLRLAPHDLFAQTQIETVHIKGLLNG